MASYLITGVNRGIGYEFLRQYSSDPKDTVIGLVRNKAETDKKVSEDADLKSRSNIHILQADMTDYSALQKAAAETAKITVGSLDYIIANAGIVSKIDAFDFIGELATNPDGLTRAMRDLFDVNVIGNIHLFNLFLPLVLASQTKKVILISSGFADVDFTIKWEVPSGPLYSASKAAANMVVAKFSAQYKKDGVLFLSLSPGMVDVGQYTGMTEEQQQRIGSMIAKFKAYAPDFKGPYTPEESVNLMRSVITNATVEKNAGDYVSQFGNRQWI